MNTCPDLPFLEGTPATQTRWVVAMSGGVDSSVVAQMMAAEGMDLVGLFMRNGVEVAEEDVPKKSCCSIGDARDARMVAASMGIPFQAVDLKQEFKSVIQYFIDEYKAGRTPNPCAVCNRDLKFSRLMDFADELGAEGVATGHYAQVEIPKDGPDGGRVIVRRGVDENKDQSYQLFCVTEAHLARARFPLGGMRKPAVRALAEKMGIRTAKKADSQEICFVPSGDYRNLLKEHDTPLHRGKIVDTAGKELGVHGGTELFTIGQRRGLGVALGEPMYVIKTEPNTGTVVLGTKAECGEFHMRFGEANWIGFDVPGSGEFRAEVQIRYHHQAAPATITVSGAEADVVFDEPQFSLAPGQGAAVYRGNRLLGGGWIRRSAKES
ncbi:MAG: tRNA-specific 2-thiouridylase [Planctomycetota bacterium]|jgi:tRNA-specific 2-thiouridylase